MKEIILTQGRRTLVDDDDYEKFNRFKWTISVKDKGRCYAYRRNPCHPPWNLYLHRIIMNADKKTYVDHINSDSLDNRKSNLRICTNAENGRNRVSLNKNNTSGFRGVFWHAQHKKWAARIMVNKKQIHLGIFKDKLDAVNAYTLANQKYFGRFGGHCEIFL